MSLLVIVVCPLSVEFMVVVLGHCCVIVDRSRLLCHCWSLSFVGHCRLLVIVVGWSLLFVGHWFFVVVAVVGHCFFVGHSSLSFIFCLCCRSLLCVSSLLCAVGLPLVSEFGWSAAVSCFLSVGDCHVCIVCDCCCCCCYN